MHYLSEDQLFPSSESKYRKMDCKNAMILSRIEGKKQQLTYLHKNTNIEKLN
jgi:hypothetical protein